MGPIDWLISGCQGKWQWRFQIVCTTWRTKREWNTGMERWNVTTSTEDNYTLNCDISFLFYFLGLIAYWQFTRNNYVTTGDAKVFSSDKVYLAVFSALYSGVKRVKGFYSWIFMHGIIEFWRPGSIILFNRQIFRRKRCKRLLRLNICNVLWYCIVWIMKIWFASFVSIVKLETMYCLFSE